RRSSVGDRRRAADHQLRRPGRVAAEEARRGAPNHDVGRRLGRQALEPQLGARRFPIGEVELREPEERVATLLAARVSHGEPADEGIAHRAATLARATHGLEPRGLACVGEERETDWGLRRALEDPMRGGARLHRLARGERLLALAEVFVRSGEDDLHFADEASDDVGEAHGVTFYQTPATLT